MVLNNQKRIWRSRSSNVALSQKKKTGAEAQPTWNTGLVDQMSRTVTMMTSQVGGLGGLARSAQGMAVQWASGWKEEQVHPWDGRSTCIYHMDGLAAYQHGGRSDGAFPGDGGTWTGA